MRPRPPACISSRGAVRVRRQVFVSRSSGKGREGRASNGFCRPACTSSRGGGPGRTASVCLAFRLEGAGRPCQQQFLSYPGTFRQAGGLLRPRPPGLPMLAGGQSGSDGKCLFRVSRGRSGKAVPATVFIIPGDLPPSRGARTSSPPRLHMLAGGGGPGKTASVCFAFQLGPVN